MLLNGAWLSRLLGTTATSALALSLASQPVIAQSLPTGGMVTAGAADILASGSDLLIDQASPYAIIGFDSFEVGAQSSVRIDNSSGATMTLVTGGAASQIDGSITVTGDLFHVNPNGVIIGPSGNVEAGGDIVITTLGIEDEDFLNGGDTSLSGGTGATAINLGRVSSLGGNVAIIANSVQNAGIINAPNGTAALAAGTEVVIRDTDLGEGLIEVRAGIGDVLNTGDIRALNAELRAHDGNVMALAGNHGGVVQASGIQTRGGRVFLTSSGGTVKVAGRVRASRGTSGGQVLLNAELLDVTGSLDVSGAEGGLIAADADLATISGTLLAVSEADNGGRIEIGGELLDIREGANLDASGETGGGTLHIGGGYQGSELMTGGTIARRVQVAEGAMLSADAGSSGDGGEIVVWSEEITGFKGRLSARGGDIDGDGGLAEISGRRNLMFDGSVDLGANAGASGTLLFDPDEIIISGIGTDDAQLADGQILFGDGGAYSTFNISSNSIETQLNADTDVILQANNRIELQAGSSITATGNGNLTLNASSYGIYTNGNITISGDLSLTTGGVIAPGAGVTLSADDVSIFTNGNVALGNITATNDLLVRSTLGGITANSTATISADDLILTAQREIDFPAAANINVATLSASTASPFNLTFSDDAGGIDLVGVSATNITINAAGGDITVSGAVTGQSIQLNNQSTGSLDGIEIGASGSLVATGTGDTIVLVSDSLSNAGGASALNPGTGRFLAYLDDFASGFTPGGIVANRLYNQTFAANPPASIAQTGNQFIFEAQPTLTLTGTDTTVTYNGTNHSLTGFTVTGLVDGHTQAQALSTNPTLGAFNDAGTYTTGLLSGGTTNLGYAIAFAQGTLTIIRRALSVGVAANDKGYDGTKAATFTFSDDRLSGDTVTYNFADAAFEDKNVGTDKTVTISGIMLGGADALNYVANTVATDLANITPRSLTISPNEGQSKLKNTEDPVLAFTLSDGTLVQGDTLLGALTRVAGEVPGDYAILLGSLDAGKNYMLIFKDGNSASQAKSSWSPRQRAKKRQPATQLRL